MERLVLSDGRWFIAEDVIWRADFTEESLWGTADEHLLLTRKGFFVLERWEKRDYETSQDPKLEDRALVPAREAAEWLMKHRGDIAEDEIPEQLRDEVEGLRL